MDWELKLQGAPTPAAGSVVFGYKENMASPKLPFLPGKESGYFLWLITIIIIIIIIVIISSTKAKAAQHCGAFEH